MTYGQYVAEMLKDQQPGMPIYTADIAQCMAVQYHMDVPKAAAAVAVAIKRIMETGQMHHLRCYQKGIYYLTVETPFGEVGINKEAVIQRKYLFPHIGYETGYMALYHMGLTTQVPAERVLATNKAKECIRKDPNLNVWIRPAKVTITTENKNYLQFLDAVELLDKAPVDVEHPYEILAKHLEAHQLNYQTLLAMANRYYNKNTVLKIAHVASAGGIIE